MRTSLLRALHALVAVGLTLVAAELALRWHLDRGVRSEEDLQERLRESENAHPEAARRMSLFGIVRPSSDPDVVYELKPNLVGLYRERTIRTNRAGLREDRDYSEDKPPGVFRIVGIGDSFMFGWGLDQGESYLDLLEEKLAETRPHQLSYEVINCAVPGYNTTMEVALLRHRCLRYDPDLVIIHFVGNDFEEPFLLQPPRAEGTMSRIVLLRLLASAWGDDEDDLPDLWYHADKELPAEVRKEAHARYNSMTGVGGYRRAMEKLSRMSREHSLPVWILVAGIGNADGEVVAIGTKHEFRLFMAARRFGEHLLEIGLEPTRKNRRRTFQLRGDHHPNQLAHSMWADDFYEALVEDLPMIEKAQ